MQKLLSLTLAAFAFGSLGAVARAEDPAKEDRKPSKKKGKKKGGDKHCGAEEKKGGDKHCGADKGGDKADGKSEKT